MSFRQRQPYPGTERKLVIAIDVGTTFSGVSYALLDPGKEPQIQSVTQTEGGTKVPSIVCYNQDGKVIAVGAETDPETNHTLAEMDDIVQAEWFKLLLRPPHLAPSHEFELQKFRSFPKDKMPVQVFSDLLKYLLESTKKYIAESELWSWKSIEKNTYFILSHPNGWEGKQQSEMRKAAIMAGFVNEPEALKRISFVSEGEASLHFCLNKNPSLRDDRDGILVVDCGGGTIDVSAYSQTTDGSFQEITSPECLFQGSIFVTCRAQEYFTQKLRNSKYGSEYEVQAMAKQFDNITKCTFNGSDTPYYVKFGGFSYNDPEFDIRTGTIKIAGKQIACFFKPALDSIVQVIDDQCAKSPVAIKVVLLVGGFARSDYLCSRLNEHFNIQDVRILRPDATYLNKAVADGAVSYHLDHYVSARIAKYSYGIEVIEPFNKACPDHRRRENRKVLHADGKFFILGGFSTILNKGTTVTEETQFRRHYRRMFTPKEFSELSRQSTTVKYYKGQAASPPQWLDLEPDSFHNACTILVDNAESKSNISRKNNGIKDYYQFDHDVVMLFGLTELKAYIAWEENGVEKRSDAFIVYD